MWASLSNSASRLVWAVSIDEEIEHSVPPLRDSPDLVAHGSRHFRAGLLVVTSLKGLVPVIGSFS